MDGFDIVKADDSEMSYHSISLYDTKAVEQVLVQGKAEVLIHTATLVNVDECEEYPEGMQRS